MSATESANDCGLNSRSTELLVSRSTHGEKVRKALSLYVGRGRRYSVKELSNGTGVPDRAIECAMCSPDSTDWRPLKVEYLASINMFLGAQFASMHLSACGLGAYELMHGEPPLPGILAAEDAQDTAEIARCAADGEFDDDECQSLMAVGQREIRRGMTLVSLAGKRVA